MKKAHFLKAGLFLCGMATSCSTTHGYSFSLQGLGNMLHDMASTVNSLKREDYWSQVKNLIINTGPHPYFFPVMGTIVLGFAAYHLLKESPDIDAHKTYMKLCTYYSRRDFYYSCVIPCMDLYKEIYKKTESTDIRELEEMKNSFIKIITDYKMDAVSIALTEPDWVGKAQTYLHEKNISLYGKIIREYLVPCMEKAAELRKMEEDVYNYFNRKIEEEKNFLREEAVMANYDLDKCPLQLLPDMSERKKKYEQDKKEREEKKKNEELRNEDMKEERDSYLATDIKSKWDQELLDNRGNPDRKNDTFAQKEERRKKKSLL